MGGFKISQFVYESNRIDDDKKWGPGTAAYDNHIKAFDYIKTRTEIELLHKDILIETHKILTTDIVGNVNKDSGKIRDVNIVSNYGPYPRFPEIEKYLEKLYCLFNGAKTEEDCWNVYFCNETIFPFVLCNGKISRLLYCVAMLKNNHTPQIIKMKTLVEKEYDFRAWQRKNKF